MDITSEYFLAMVSQDTQTQCSVHDKTPGSETTRINVVVRSHYTVEKVISDIKILFGYEQFDLILQPIGEDLVYLNDHRNSLLYEIPGFEPKIKNTLILLPPGKWNGDVKQHFSLPLRPLKCITANHQQIQSIQLQQSQTSQSSQAQPSQQIHQMQHIEQMQQMQQIQQMQHMQQQQLPQLPQKQNHNLQLQQYPQNLQNVNQNQNLQLNYQQQATNHLDDRPYNYSNNYTSYTNTTITTTTTTSNMNNNNNLNNNLNNINNNNMSMCIDTVMNSPSTCAPSSPSTTTNVSDSLNLSPMSENEQLSDDDLALGASASPTETDVMNENGMSLGDSSAPHSIRNKFIPINEGDSDNFYKNDDDATIKPYYEQQMPLAIPATTPTERGYVGLVNQAMTCYLNSLLQALYMTPEFRNGLYNWEFDNDNEAKSIPYQLQKLFLNLQTSQKSAVETTDLTRSFGWDSSEAWQQHDIQELCRVMFDALEHKFKNTKQSDLISSLYEGKMIDYVKCLECNTEKSREDTFLDIPLPVRPFGHKEAYGSIEEALRAFVQPETLDGNNQYLCEKCNKKCDAHKGLKFKYFPYVLTLHLKRFDFNYQTMHRIKINDKVTFPEVLNLNSFIENSDVTNTTINGTTDDCSTTDSGSAMDEDNYSIGIATNSSGPNEADMNDEDEGIDMSTSTDHRVHSASSTNGNNLATELQEKGPYVYELFAIMIHSGSASGGHYFAYIKEFETNEWFCFNDQSVTPITQEDIEKSYGGGSTRPYYASVYSSSINAYMLMYRQVDPKRNQRAMKIDDFPQHINALLPRLRMENECRISRVSRHHSSFTELTYAELVKHRVYFYNPSLKKLKMCRVSNDTFDLRSVLESSYEVFDVEQFAPLSQCRLVGYDLAKERIIQSFENDHDVSLMDGIMDFLLECRTEGQEFEVYHPGGTTWYVFMVNLHTMEMDGPFLVYSSSRENDDVLKHSIAVRLHVKENEFILATLKTYKAFVAYDPLPTKEAEDRLQAIAETRFRHLTCFFLNVPCVDPTNLEILGIPPYEPPKPIYEISADCVDAVLMNGNISGSVMQHSNHSFVDTVDNAGNCVINAKITPNVKCESPLPTPVAQYNGSSTATGHESNSEDSSLSDGDRTLVESTPNRSASQGANGRSNSRLSSRSHSPDISSPEDESAVEDRLRTFYSNIEDDAACVSPAPSYRFFHAIKTDAIDISTLNCSFFNSTEDDNARKPTHAYKIIVDSHMKMSEFKNHVEKLIRVPNNYFKIVRKQHDSYMPKQNQPLLFLNEAETLTVELGKVLQNDEFKAKICFMRLSDLNDDVGKLGTVCEWIHNSTTTALAAKQELVAKLHRIDAKYHTLTVDNCRLWLKSGRNPYKIYNDYELIATDFRVSMAVEFMIQECEKGVKSQVSKESLTLFVRQWHPDKYELGKFQEITINKGEDIRVVLSKLSGIPEANIDYCKVSTSFPCTNISILSINSSMNWHSVSATPEKYPLTSASPGNVFFYKDNTKEIRELKNEERRELNIREKIRLDRLGYVSSSRFSPRRERALKIYLDSPQTSAKRQDIDQAVDN